MEDKLAAWSWFKKKPVEPTLTTYGTRTRFTADDDDDELDDAGTDEVIRRGSFSNSFDQPFTSPLSDSASRVVPRTYSIQPRSTKFEAPTFKKGIFNYENEESKTRELLEDYRSTKSERSLEKLYGLYQRQIDGLITSTSTGRLPEPAVRARTYTAFKDAVDKYDTGSQKKFYNYFVDNHFSSVRNYFRPYSNFRKVVHHRAANLDAVSKIKADLELELGREPSRKEISTEYRKLYSKTLSEGELKTMMKELAPEHLGSAELDNSYMADAGRQMYIAALRARDNVPPAERKVFDALIIDPLEGNASKTQREVAKDYGLSTSRMNRKAQEYRTSIQREFNVLTR